MATVTALADRVCQNTGLLTTGTERALVIAALNNAYQRAVAESLCYRDSSTETLVSGQSSYDLSSDFSLTDILQIVSVRVSGVISNQPLRAVSDAQLRVLAQGDNATGTPVYFTTQGINKISVWPTPGSADSMVIDYVKSPPTLVESTPGAGEETTPSAVPARFHWDVLCSGAIVEALDKDQRGGDSDRWRARFEMGLAGLMDHVTRFAGESTPLVSVDDPVGGDYPDVYWSGA